MNGCFELGICYESEHRDYCNIPRLTHPVFPPWFDFLSENARFLFLEGAFQLWMIYRALVDAPSRFLLK